MCKLHPDLLYITVLGGQMCYYHLCQGYFGLIVCAPRIIYLQNIPRMRYYRGQGYFFGKPIPFLASGNGSF